MQEWTDAAVKKQKRELAAMEAQVMDEVSLRERKRERESVCVCVFVCVRESE